jgi:hypothetical protein
VHLQDRFRVVSYSKVHENSSRFSVVRITSIYPFPGRSPDCALACSAADAEAEADLAGTYRPKPRRME